MDLDFFEEFRYSQSIMAKLKRQFNVLVERDEDGYFVASVPALPGCYTQAKTFTELIKRVKEAILLCLSVAKENPRYARRLRLSPFQH